VSLTDLERYELIHAPSLPALTALLADRHASGLATVLLAGGTDWLVEQETRPPTPAGAFLPVVVDVSRMPELRGIELVGDRLRVGAATTYLELRRSAVVRERAPLLARMAADVGALQIQARGTLGGNLATASPAADGVAALAALDADVIVESARGRRAIPFASLQTGYKRGTRAPDEVIVAVEIALPKRGAPFVWRKVGTRRAQAISKVALAGVAEVEGGRLARLGLGMASVAPVTTLLPTVRALATSKPLAAIGAAEVDAAVDADVTPIDDVRSTAAYRRHVAKALVRRFLASLGAAL
jgi:CO/xanthine dehydrogenase FAD-binding subunit